MGERFYVYYDKFNEIYLVIDTHDDTEVSEHKEEAEAFTYCDHLNEGPDY